MHQHPYGKPFVTVAVSTTEIQATTGYFCLQALEAQVAELLASCNREGPGIRNFVSKLTMEIKAVRKPQFRNNGSSSSENPDGFRSQCGLS
jgi:hypothetical protein